MGRYLLPPYIWYAPIWSGSHLGGGKEKLKKVYIMGYHGGTLAMNNSINLSIKYVCSIYWKKLYIVFWKLFFLGQLILAAYGQRPKWMVVSLPTLLGHLLLQATGGERLRCALLDFRLPLSNMCLAFEGIFGESITN
jgi:hypothetical protein